MSGHGCAIRIVKWLTLVREMGQDRPHREHHAAEHDKCPPGGAPDLRVSLGLVIRLAAACMIRKTTSAGTGGRGFTCSGVKTMP